MFVFDKVGKIVQETGDAAVFDFMASSFTRLVSLTPSDVAEGEKPVWLAGQHIPEHLFSSGNSIQTMFHPTHVS